MVCLSYLMLSRVVEILVLYHRRTFLELCIKSGIEIIYGTINVYHFDVVITSKQRHFNVIHRLGQPMEVFCKLTVLHLPEGLN